MKTIDKRNTRLMGLFVFVLLATIVGFGYSNMNVMADSDFLVNDSFDNEQSGAKPSGYMITEDGGKVEIADEPGSGDKSLYLFDPGKTNIKISKSFAPQTKVITAELTFMQPELGSTAKVVRLLDEDNSNIAVQIETRKGTFGYKNADSSFSEFGNYAKNEWTTLSVIADVTTQKADIYVNGELQLSQVSFLAKVENIGRMDSFTPGSSGKSHYLNNLKIVIGAVKPNPPEQKSMAKSPAVSFNQEATGSQLITDLKILCPTTPWEIQPSIRVGEKQYVDRAFYIAKLPEAYVGCEFIQTACDCKKYFKDPLASFKLTADAEVYVAYDDRVVTKPEWMKDWVDTGDDLVNTELNPTVFSIFKKKFSANSIVVLGQNGQSSGCINYMVFVKGPNWNPEASKTGKNKDVPEVVTWKGILGLRSEWYSSPEAIRIADNILTYQYDTGGWYKNIDMAVPLKPEEKKIIESNKSSKTESTIDNDATTTQIRYLARVYSATKIQRFKTAFIKGMNFLFAAQYANGGWPQYYPVQEMEYYKHITYNDNAMVEVLQLMQAIIRQEPDFTLVDFDMRNRAKIAFDKGINCILKTQIRVNGKLTAWGAQHDEKTLAPVAARAYEKVSIATSESVGIVYLLMSLDNPSPPIKAAVQNAVEWFDAVSLSGVEVRQQPNPKLERGFDMVAVQNLKAPSIWARFYEIGTDRPIFCGRDGIVKYSLGEVEHERRTGYSWYNFAPGALLVNDYPKWKAKWMEK